ncbi:daunorubicin resistance protein DrrA family ABC transporter ATP-binding protein [Microbispora rosea subsp. aerata]|nr:ATP-binding cassette domain-containing protein [Microbispora rosea]GGO15438.1 daunorubicin resistance protein DrrA family ABC transporter ATP-binding protein [Microbispora rosea subsp. aerata]GIH57587.1 daunorubicin resistance protein DrrA family ABC transporter ATP-binding protein [Microbispora rosea subsp. aerata]GLJ85558.1 daunorubicin resistance protein DrrA family ABC transporter ATP-binding protein [Microbispora rosea subsp. aerata]
MIIDARGLRKTYRRRGRGAEPVEAVRGVDLQVAEGEIFGVLGPNGAGKTTTIRMLATLVAPSGGSATVAGHDLLTTPEQVRRRIGYVGQAGGVDENNTPRANLLLAARVNGMTAAQAAARTGEVLAAFGLSALADRPARTLSGGQKRRVALALGLVHRPPLLFLDEPTTGLDPQNRANLWDQIKGLRDGGTSVLLSTHYLDEADALCDRLAIVDHGLVVAEGTPAELKREIAGDVVSLRVSDTREAAKALRGLPYAREIKAGGDLLRVYLDDGERALPHLLATLTEHGLALESVALDRATLDDVFLHKTGRSLRDAA